MYDFFFSELFLNFKIVTKESKRNSKVKLILTHKHCFFIFVISEASVSMEVSNYIYIYIYIYSLF